MIAKFLTESEIGLGDDFIAPEGMMGPEHFGDVQFEGALQMIFFAWVFVPQNLILLLFDIPLTLHLNFRN